MKTKVRNVPHRIERQRLLRRLAEVRFQRDTAERYGDPVAARQLSILESEILEELEHLCRAK